MSFTEYDCTVLMEVDGVWRPEARARIKAEPGLDIHEVVRVTMNHLRAGPAKGMIDKGILVLAREVESQPEFW